MAGVPRWKRCAAETIGTASLLIAIVGSGIMGERLAGGNDAIALLANSLATGAGLASLIFVFAPISGANFNPLVTLMAAVFGELRWQDVPGYVIAQFAGALLGVALAHAMFSEPIFSLSQHPRSGLALAFSEVVATIGLLLVIRGGKDQPRIGIAVAVGCYIMAAYWFTSSTSFANPAVTLARAWTDTFSGIRPIDVPGFLAAQLVGATIATGLARWFEGSQTARKEP